MKKLLTTITILSLLISSCKKKSIEPTIEKQNNVTTTKQIEISITPLDSEVVYINNVLTSFTKVNNTITTNLQINDEIKVEIWDKDGANFTGVSIFYNDTLQYSAQGGNNLIIQHKIK